MAKLPWFRLHAEFAFDPKIQSLSETLQRRFIMLLCLECNGDLVSLDENELASAMRITPDDLQETKQIFVQKGFIDPDWNIVNWNKRQYKSDSSTDRVKRFRKKHPAKKKKRSSNVDVTPPDTDTDTDTDTDKKKVTPPKWLDNQAWQEWVQHRKEIKKKLTPLTKTRQWNLLEKFQDQQAEIINYSITGGYTGLFEPKKQNNSTWKLSDGELNKLAADLHVSTKGKTRDQLIRDIDAKRAA